VFSGAVGVGVGFGLQKVVSNLISGVILLMDRSIKPGDVIEIDGTYGSVIALNARYASAQTRDGKEYLTCHSRTTSFVCTSRRGSRIAPIRTRRSRPRRPLRGRPGRSGPAAPPPDPLRPDGQEGRRGLWHRARDFDRSTHQPGRHGGSVGHAGLQVLHALIFDFLNHWTGRLDPSYAAIAHKAGVCVHTVATALKRLRELGILNWVRRCAESWRDGRFRLEQETNAYAVLPESQWRGYRPPEEPPGPAPGT
jgi:hypothetical protein